MEAQGVDVRLVVPGAADPSDPAPVSPPPDSASPDPTGPTAPPAPAPEAPVVSAPGPAAPSPFDPAEAAAPGVPAAPPPTSFTARLPRTGAELLAVLLVAVVLLALGTLLVKAGRARRRPV